MKELSIKEKAERYDEALVWMQDLYPTMEGAMREDAKHYFPQLKESKDEKIRKEIINFIKISKPEWENYSDYSSWIAWLEKQGDNPTPINIDKMVMEYSQTKDSDFGLPVNCMIRAYRQGIIDVLNLSSGIEKQDKQILANSTKTCNDEHKNVEWHREDEQNLNTCLSYIPDEYLRRWLVDVVHVKYDKPADKVKPKFHKGEWVIFNEHHNSVYQVEKIQGLRYYLRHYLGGTLSVRFDTELIRLWTLQDAKSGDVLVDKYNNIGIYKEIEGIYWDSYIYLGCDGTLYDFRVGGMHDQTQTHPATKGQRDNLLKAMAEAGWDFDFDKKELKKIKPIDEYEGLTDFERAVADACIGFIDKEDPIGWKQYVKDSADDLLKIAVKKFNAVQDDTTIAINNEEAYKIGFSDGEAHAKGEMTSAWSEDDEGICRAIINDIANDKSMCTFDISKGICDKKINWLKALKDRVACEANCTTTKWWSEDEESIINKAESWLDTLCDYLKDSSPEYISDIKDVINKLKSLKDRIGG